MFRFIVGVISILSLSLASQGASGDLTRRLTKIVERSGLNKEHVGVYVADANGQELGEINGRKNFIPASLTKIIPAAAVLNQWDQSFNFKTQIYVDSEVKDRTLKGSLFLKGGGDPSLVSEKFWFFVNILAREEISVIEGDLVVDESRFDSIRFDSGRDAPVEGRAFDAPVGAMSFNWNSVNVFVRPGRAAGEAAIVNIDPPNNYIVGVINRAKTVASGDLAINVSREPVKQGGQIIGDRVFVSGRIPLKNKEVVYYRSISEPDLWAGSCLVEFLKQRNIVLKGRVRRGAVPNSARLLIEMGGSSVGDMVQDMMKFSNNYVAEMLTKNLAAESGERSATIVTGVEHLKKYLDTLKIPRTDYVITSPSGLSRRNSFSSYALFKVLHETKKDFSVFPEFMSSFPVAGIDGTLKNRMKASPARRWVRAKTGLLDGVSSLGGYIGQGDQTLTFVFMYNGPKDMGARDAFDKMVAALFE